jgi:hypothetical protein
MPDWGKPYRELTERIERGEVVLPPSYQQVVVMELGAIRRLLQRQAGVVPPMADHWHPGESDACTNCAQVLAAHWFDGEWDRCRLAAFQSHQARREGADA